MGVLATNFVLGKSRAQDLARVRELNAWGQELDDVSVLRQMCNLEVLSLACNNLETLRDVVQCRRLRQLFLRKNQIGDVAELVHLAHLQQLRVLSLVDNPCAASTDDYRFRTRNEFSLLQIQVLSILPQLETLDEQPVATEEVAAARRLYPDVPAAPRSPVPVGRLSTGYGDERRRMSATPPASPQPAFAAASPAAAPRVTADRVSPSAWNSSQPSAVDRDGSPAQQVRPPHAAGASGFGSAQRGRAEPYSQPNGVLNDGDAMVDWPGAAAHASGSRSPPGSHFDATPPQEAAPDSRPSAAGNSSPHGRVAQQDQILFAVMSLLPLLGPDHIRVVSSEAEELLRKQGE